MIVNIDVGSPARATIGRNGHGGTITVAKDEITVNIDTDIPNAIATHDIERIDVEMIKWHGRRAEIGAIGDGGKYVTIDCHCAGDMRASYVFKVTDVCDAICCRLPGDVQRTADRQVSGHDLITARRYTTVWRDSERRK